jgi:two-component system, NtrC family, C4-dicarboxylate transport sensor histidine kinase DctB
MCIILSMSRTIDDFRIFFKPSGTEKSFSLITSIQEALSIVGASLKNSDIVLAIDYSESLTGFGLPNKFAHVMLNLFGECQGCVAEK